MERPAIVRHRWILLPVIALSVVLDFFAILTSVLLEEWLTVGVGLLLLVLLLVAYSTVRDFRP